ncbi:DUF3892 domain-containing protein [Oceanobacillus bengalensis]|uniref:DUF3892 domain-containing protein n=1 Tax=Oceanobacillus bengalensis TaxID=1435466 RepID=A0A494YSC5_9BACI|nr:DUF3892 domain-containing protein [Oceanobacillus bengalensis]RKQ12462.1 DUF3892 domain-containing protein [Oceanobacillus bengalensis]
MTEKDFEEIYNKYKNQSKTVEGSLSSIGKEEIIAVRKNEDGDIIAFKTNSGRELDYLTALNEAKTGKIDHIDVFQKYGRDIIRSEPDGIRENNLDQLPLF